MVAVIKIGTKGTGTKKKKRGSMYPEKSKTN